jgi:hypothetical protein
MKPQTHVPSQVGFLSHKHVRIPMPTEGIIQAYSVKNVFDQLFLFSIWLVIKFMELKSQTYQNRLPIGFLDHERLTKSRG